MIKDMSERDYKKLLGPSSKLALAPKNLDSIFLNELSYSEFC